MRKGFRRLGSEEGGADQQKNSSKVSGEGLSISWVSWTFPRGKVLTEGIKRNQDFVNLETMELNERPHILRRLYHPCSSLTTPPCPDCPQPSSHYPPARRPCRRAFSPHPATRAPLQADDSLVDDLLLGRDLPVVREE